MDLIGVPKLIRLIGAAGGAAIFVRPPPGMEWIVIEMYGYHNDNTGQKDCYWEIKDQYNTAGLLSTAIAENVKLPFSITFPLIYRTIEADTGKSEDDANLYRSFPAKLTYFCYAVFVPDIGSGKRGYVDAYVLERPENIELQLFTWLSGALKYPLPAQIKDRLDSWSRKGV
jgi:hypothetical protein